MMQQILTKVITNLFQTDPALVSTVVAAITASGSNIPLIGVTNGSDAQPGQVGEWVSFSTTVSFTSAAQSQTLSMGILPAGDWDIWAEATTDNEVNDMQFQLQPLPAGFTTNLWSVLATYGTALAMSLPSTTGRALISVPSPIVLSFQTNQWGVGAGAGTAYVVFGARRRR